MQTEDFNVNFTGLSASIQLAEQPAEIVEAPPFILNAKFDAKIHEYIGGGGFAAVYTAEVEGIPVAMKIFKRRQWGEGEFRNWARRIAQLPHGGCILPVYARGDVVANGSSYFVYIMPLADSLYETDCISAPPGIAGDLALQCIHSILSAVDRLSDCQEDPDHVSSKKVRLLQQDMRGTNWLAIQGVYFLGDGSLAIPETMSPKYSLQDEITNIVLGALAPKIMAKEKNSIDDARANVADLLKDDPEAVLETLYGLGSAEVATLRDVPALALRGISKTQKVIETMLLNRQAKFPPYPKLLSVSEFWLKLCGIAFEKLLTGAAPAEPIVSSTSSSSSGARDPSSTSSNEQSTTISCSLVDDRAQPESSLSAASAQNSMPAAECGGSSSGVATNVGGASSEIDDSRGAPSDQVSSRAQFSSSPLPTASHLEAGSEPKLKIPNSAAPLGAPSLLGLATEKGSAFRKPSPPSTNFQFSDPLMIRVHRLLSRLSIQVQRPHSVMPETSSSSALSVTPTARNAPRHRQQAQKHSEASDSPQEDDSRSSPSILDRVKQLRLEVGERMKDLTAPADPSQEAPSYSLSSSLLAGSPLNLNEPDARPPTPAAGAPTNIPNSPFLEASNEPSSLPTSPTMNTVASSGSGRLRSPEVPRSVSAPPQHSPERALDAPKISITMHGDVDDDVDDEDVRPARVRSRRMPGRSQSPRPRSRSPEANRSDKNGIRPEDDVRGAQAPEVAEPKKKGRGRPVQFPPAGNLDAPASVMLDPISPQDLAALDEVQVWLAAVPHFDRELARLAARCLAASMQVLNLNKNFSVRNPIFIKEESTYATTADRASNPRVKKAITELSGSYSTLAKRYSDSKMEHIVDLRKRLVLAPSIGSLMDPNGLSTKCYCSEVVHSFLSIFVASVGGSALETFSRADPLQSYQSQIAQNRLVRVDFAYETVHIVKELKARKFTFNEELWRLLRFFVNAKRAQDT
eukprot:TRINITY_DN11654_c0_g1_i1.p1 TRINITY_DN11654_c0_g1~~TRINITY_DN11654_c0_g1_i1.p1  ORF type:complete len:972 (-),score=140.14 TRINITY_DN11654_c0_g1_i1:337-3252(-)